jgi:hypothetical protein
VQNGDENGNKIVNTPGFEIQDDILNSNNHESDDGISESADNITGSLDEIAINDTQSDLVPEIPGINDSDDVTSSSPVQKERLLFSLFAALVGAILGLIPATLSAYWFKATFYPLFVAAPLLIYLFNKLFRGSRDMRTFVITTGFSLASAYVTALACHVTVIVHQVLLVLPTFEMSISRIPGFTVDALVQPSILPESASAFVYPFVFTALGIIITLELLCGTASSRKKTN